MKLRPFSYRTRDKISNKKRSKIQNSPSSNTCVCLGNKENFDQKLNPSVPLISNSLPTSANVRPRPTPGLSVSVDSLENHQINRQNSENFIEMNRDNNGPNYLSALMTLPKFNNNDSQSASKFIANFDALREIAQWDNHAAAKHFQFLLTEGPSDWFQTLDEYTKNDYNLLKQMFLQNFDSSRNNTFNLLETYNRLQKPDEKVEKYLAALYKLFANNKDMSEKSKVVIFLKGLKPKIRDFVITTNPTTLADASASAKLKESLLNNSSDSIPGTTLNFLSQLKQSETEQKLNTITNEIKNIISYLGNNDNRNDTANNNARLKQNYSRHIYDNYKLSQNNQPEISELQNAIFKKL